MSAPRSLLTSSRHASWVYATKPARPEAPKVASSWPSASNARTSFRTSERAVRFAVSTCDDGPY